MTKSSVLGIDLAKRVIQVCHISKHGELLTNKAISPNKLKELLAKSRPSIVAMEGSGSSHYWARLAQQYGHDVRMISPKKVKAFLQGHKTDANDALAIAVASTQTGMRFSQIKKEDQQWLQTLETSRKYLERERTALSNHIRAYLYEYGIIMNRGYKSLRETMANVLDPQDSRLPACLKNTLRVLWERYQLTIEQFKETEKYKSELAKQLEPCRRLVKLEGVGAVCASMLYTSIGDGKAKQHSSGGKTYLKGIDKQGGHKELRAALYQGALSYISRLPIDPRTQKEVWLMNLVKRVGVKRACVALANKTVRTAWALLNTGSNYQSIASIT